MVQVFGFLIVLGIVYSTLVGDTAWVSRLISVSFVYSFFLFIKNNLLNKHSYELDRLVIISAILVFLNVTIVGAGGFDYYKKAIMYTATLSWIAYSTHAYVVKKTVIIVIVINAIINILYLLYYQRGFSVHENQILLTLNFSNPNQAGMFILNSLLYMGILIASGRNIISKTWIYIVMLVVLVPIIMGTTQLLVLTGCRSSFMAFAAFIFLVIIDYISKGRFKLKHWMVFLIVIMPYVFVFLYLTFVREINIDVSMGVEEAGKSSFTRISVWKPIIDHYFHYFIFGDYFGISHGTGMSQLHNTHLDVYASYGIIPLVLYIAILYKSTCNLLSKAKCRFQRVSIYAFIACMISYTFEASFVAGSGGLFLLTIGFLLIANYSMYENLTS